MQGKDELSLLRSKLPRGYLKMAGEKCGYGPVTICGVLKGRMKYNAEIISVLTEIAEEYQAKLKSISDRIEKA